MSAPLPRMQVQLIEEAIARSRVETTAVGTITSVDSDVLQAMVAFDGSGGSLPCLVGAHVSCVANDRVGLQRFGAEWVVMVNLGTLRWPGAGGLSVTASAGSAPVGSWGNLPGTPNFAFTKRWDATRVKWTTVVSLFGVIAEVVQLGISYDGGSSTVKTTDFQFANTAGTTFVADTLVTGFAFTSGLVAGDYTIHGRWQATGSVQVTAADWYSLSAEEISP